MSNSEQVKCIPAFTIKMERTGYGGDGYEFRARFTFVDPSIHKGECREGQLSSWSCGAAAKFVELEHFVFHSYLYDTGSHYGDGGQFEFTLRANTHEIAAAHRVSVRLDKGMEKLLEERGYPADLAEHFGRVCEVLGVKLILEYNETDRKIRTGYTYRSFDTVGSAVGRVRDMVNEIKERHAVPAAV